MPKKVVAVRLEPSTINELQKHGNPSTLLRKMVEENLKPNVVYKEVPSLGKFGEDLNRRIDRELIDGYKRDQMPNWYIEEMIKDYERRYN